ncbi:hypothetical protein [Nocardiopsis sp. CNT312]|uniref:hypothetical protein n=1 Tax=Nocardiopsis sp. CNT312 TaxID=1137268 RepID=UPI0004907770|nr:hypothetical protein [Nocardiopsis sp. CNT312]
MARALWRVRLSAALAFTDHLLAHVDSYVAACLDIRPVRVWGAELATWLGQTWRAHLHTAHVRRYGPGRGVIAVVINRPTNETEETHER